MAKIIKLGFLNNDDNLAIESLNVKLSISLGVTDGRTYYDASDVLYENKGITDKDGLISFDLSTLMTNTTFVKFYKAYSEKYKLEFKLVIEVPKTDLYNFFITKVTIAPKIIVDKESYLFDDIDYTSDNDYFYLLPIKKDEQKTITVLRAEYKTKELEFLVAKTLYETEINSTTDIVLEKENDYEPSTFKNIITRLLEFQEGTLLPGIKYTSEAKLTDVNTKLSNISKLINLITKQYPNINIEDGEGLPYSKLIPEPTPTPTPTPNTYSYSVEIPAGVDIVDISDISYLGNTIYKYTGFTWIEKNYDTDKFIFSLSNPLSVDELSKTIAKTTYKDGTSQELNITKY